MKKELAASFVHGTGNSFMVIESRWRFPLPYRKRYTVYVQFDDGEEVLTSSSPEFSDYDEAYQWGWDQILEWVLNG